MVGFHRAVLTVPSSDIPTVWRQLTPVLVPYFERNSETSARKLIPVVSYRRAVSTLLSSTASYAGKVCVCEEQWVGCSSAVCEERWVGYSSAPQCPNYEPLQGCRERENALTFRDDLERR